MGTIIVAPLGMKYDLARKLVEDGAFAHIWLCHNGNEAECVDGCAGEHTSGNMTLRVKLYNDIHVWSVESHVRAYKRGFEDASKERPALFRSTRDRGIVPECGSEWDEDMADEWCDEMRQAYLDGYDRAAARF